MVHISIYREAVRGGARAMAHEVSLLPRRWGSGVRCDLVVKVEAVIANNQWVASDVGDRDVVVVIK